jgi:hypothetical protein
MSPGSRPIHGIFVKTAEKIPATIKTIPKKIKIFEKSFMEHGP